MSAFHNDIFNRRAGSFSGGFPPSGFTPRPLFTDNPRPHFAYVRGCHICEDYVCRGVEICHHEHVCHSTSSSGNGYSARTEESTTDSAFANGRVRARSATTTVGDASFGFANMDAEMLRMAADNKWRTPAYDPFYGRPFSGNCLPPAEGHVSLRQDNVDHVFKHHHHMMHADKQAQMHREAQAHFSSPRHCHVAARQCAEEEDEVKVTTTTTTTTTTKIIPCETTHCHPPPSPSPRCIEARVVECHTPTIIVKPSCHDTVLIPIGVKPDGPPIKPAESCCTWCKFLPCLSCPKPTNANARFHKLNFRLYPEYEFLSDTAPVPRASEYFPEHSHVASRADFRVNIPKITDIAQRIYVDFIADQMVICGEHGKPTAAPRNDSLVRASTRSSTSAFNEKAS
ncbi:hypothetical protein GGI21_005292, partial [Coemansia aciculifera]